MPLAAFVVYHLTDQHLASARASSVALEGAPTATGALALGIVVLAAIALHAVLGLSFGTAGRAADAHWPRPAGWSQRFQRISGLAVLLFVVAHAWLVAVPVLVGSVSMDQRLALLGRVLSTSTMGVPTWGLVHLLGLVACAAHLAHGLWGTSAAFGIGSSERSSRVAASLGAVLAIALVVLGGDAIVRAATGDGLAWPWRDLSKGVAEPLPASCESAPPDPSARGAAAVVPPSASAPPDPSAEAPAALAPPSASAPPE